MNLMMSVSVPVVRITSVLKYKFLNPNEYMHWYKRIDDDNSATAIL